MNTVGAIKTSGVDRECVCRPVVLINIRFAFNLDLVCRQQAEVFKVQRRERERGKRDGREGDDRSRRLMTRREGRRVEKGCGVKKGSATKRRIGGRRNDPVICRQPQRSAATSGGRQRSRCAKLGRKWKRTLTVEATPSASHASYLSTMINGT